MCECENKNPMDEVAPLVNAMEWLKKEHPAAFSDILYAILVSADEDELDGALEAAGWNDDFGDINLLISRTWLAEQLDEDGIDSIEEELREAICAYLEEAGQADTDCYVAVIDDTCLCCGCCEECDCGDDIPDEDEAELPWRIAVDSDFEEKIGEELAASLVAHIDEHIVVPIFEKYGLVEDDNDEDAKE